MPTGPQIILDFPVGYRATDSQTGTELIRPVALFNAVATGSPASIISQALAISGMPKIYDAHPVVTYAICMEHRLRTLESPSGFIVECVYRSAVSTANAGTGGLGSIWSVTDTTQTNVQQVFASADGSDSFYLWYQNGYSGTTEPTNTDQISSFTAPKVKPFRTIRATGAYLGVDWASNSASLYTYAGYINSLPWAPLIGGSRNTLPRGSWLFLGPTSTTNDHGNSYVVSVDIVSNPDRWYWIEGYLDPLGIHPPDCASYATMLGLLPPAVGTVVRRNGMAAASVYKEVDFNTIFAF